MPTAQSAVRRVFEEAFNQGDQAAVDELGFTRHFPPAASRGAPHGPRSLNSLSAMVRTAFPDLQWAIEGEIQEGDTFAAHWKMRGTPLGSFLGNPPTGRPIAAQGIIFVRIENGRLVEDWTLIDQLSILQQLGLIPPPAGS
jgi:predicted ester cyclase